MSRSLTLREECNKLRLVDEPNVDDNIDNNDKDADEFIAVEDDEDDEEIVIANDDEDEIEVVKERER